jgi:phosphoribosyl 1,2-cyclic phosphate phosphodiesterase
MTYRLTFLGSGSSGGVPRVAGGWGACDPKNPKNRRRRCAVLIEKIGTKGITTILIDTPPDVREGLLAQDVQRVDAVLFTHDHADHTHGIDDLRGFALSSKARVPVYMDDPTFVSLEARFRYCFETRHGSTYPPILKRLPIVAGETIRIDGPGGVLEALPIEVIHGDMMALGFRVADTLYSPDISAMPTASERYLAGLKLWIVDALRPMPHQSHWSVKQALSAIAHYGVPEAILTHMTHELDYEELKRFLPPGVVPAYDGMVVTF